MMGLTFGLGDFSKKYFPESELKVIVTDSNITVKIVEEFSVIVTEDKIIVKTEEY
jgi:hypothetical protein